MDTHPDVLIVGLGPAGASAAAAAAAAGCRVLGIDRRQRIGWPVQCAEFVSQALSVPGLDWDAVSTQAISGMRTFVEDGGPRINGDFRGRMISRGRFDQALVERARQLGACCRADTALSGLRPDGTAYLADGTQVRARVLIGCDGPRSLIGAAIGQRNVELVAARQITVPLRERHEDTDIFLRAGYRGGYGWLFPRGEHAHVGVGIDYGSRQQLKSRLRQLQSDLQDSGRIDAGGADLTGGLIPVGGRLRVTGHCGGVPALLAGDAAGLTNPVTGAGIESAVQSGRLAGEAAAAWLQGSVVALEDYAEEIADLHDGPQRRALWHRRSLLARYAARGPSADCLWRAWIAAPEYWQESAG